MKQLLMICAILMIAFGAFGQVPAEPKLKFQGGLWSGTNGITTIVGVPAAKLSATFRAGEKMKLETGLMLIPGLIIDNTGARLGLSAGGTITFRKEKWKLNPVVGVVFVKTNTWQAMPGIGFVF